ncbi:Carboxylesterase NlhH [Pedobacter sp. Bi27]|uniref:alpha/beta hydrolase n=1 Tax=unclassified Pedobacter TaxID=2628915 RepID=UPI001D66D1A7|nr:MULTISPECIES: alpha/beta hydrolase [unclassified Pedobacter]CAH0148737.1 Carboxylesterase NlhH [Pedobacter sp. Bi36]CAH0204725.1 Carboxylesterase NlhH [Pedobacter sp. Bi126]CAH0263003.1 Carboxylesterase NlhH [Pedobacter sp. Bi27]
MKTNWLKPASFICAVAVCIAACTGGTKTTTITNSTITDSSVTAALKPAGPAPEWGKTIKPEMQAVIEKLNSYGDKPLETLSAADARKNHTPTDAVMDLAKQNNITIPTTKVDTIGKDIDVSGGKIHLRIYTPKAGNGPYPLIVYYHGGGFVIANLDVYNASAQALAEQVGAVVVSVAYRLAPENKFPTAHNDAFTAYEWAVKNAVNLKADPAKIAIVGESAGGNLAANVSIMARDKHIMLPVHQVLIYPIAQADMNTESYKMYEKAKPLNKAMMGWFTEKYLTTMIEAQDPKISLVNANLNGLPSTTIITAEIDPLHDDGVILADKLKAAGIKVDSKNYEGVTHEFFGMALLVPEAKAAQAYAAHQLKAAFK